MNDHSHRGSRPSSLFNQATDRRIIEIDEALRGVEAMFGGMTGLSMFRDPTRAAAAATHSLNYPFRISRGTIIHALPYVNWYKVQVADGAGWIAACCGTPGGSMMPMGPKELNMPGPNDDVLVFKPRGLNYGFILQVLPSPVADGATVVPDWVVQGGGSGLFREPGHSFPISSMYKRGGVIDWSDNRPKDMTPLERGFVTPTGVAVTVDDEMAQLRVNEMTGLWMTVYDSWCRLAGNSLLVESSIHETDTCTDEGEARYFHGIATYPHEALGLYAPGINFTATFDDKAVVNELHKANVDLPDGEEDLQPIYRYQEYGGYLGQGHLRFVIKPGNTTGKQQYGQVVTDVGLFMESVSLDGYYSLVSAKGLHIGKRSKIVVPKAMTLPQASEGDDAAAGNYKFSSLFGNGANHKVGDVRVNGADRSLLKVSAALDFAAYLFNWKAIHPFHYHHGDYRTPNPSDISAIPRTQEVIDFGEASNTYYAADPEPLMLEIDHRYGNVELFERESFIHFHDDGSVHLVGGAGEEIIFCNGRVGIRAPLGLDVSTGTDVTMLTDQIVLRAKGSVDVSSSTKDVRIKAERNMHFIAGNSGEGGILFDCKSTQATQQYDGRYGEDVVSNGIVFRAPNSVVALLSQDIYLRTGGPGLGEGDILFDASRGRRRVQIYGNEFNAYITDGVTFNYGPVADSSSIDKVYAFTKESMLIDTQLYVGGRIVGYSGGGGSSGIIVDGAISSTESISAAGVMADSKGMFLGKVPSAFESNITSECNKVSKSASSLVTTNETVHADTIVQKYYQPSQVGNEDLVPIMEFSFRDPPGSSQQYGTDNFRITESRWQQFVRFGMATGGTPWIEMPVFYQGTETYPWPGKKKWVDEPTMNRLTSLNMFDPSAGQDSARPGTYENPSVSDFDTQTCNGNYTLNRE